MLDFLSVYSAILETERIVGMTAHEIFSLLGGVGLFLYGMTIMSTGLKNACGEKLKTILEYATKNKYVSVLVGICVTVLIQSSSATDVMVIGFVNSGLMNLSQAIGVILGANIGTTVTAQITAFNISAYAPLILFVGAVIYLFVGKPFIKHVGCVIMGFGMLFEGVALMKSAIAPLASTPAFIALVSSLRNPLITVLFGVAFTALLQSSSSATVIFQAFAMEGIINYHTAAYLCIGAAIGSVTPNVLASLTANRNGKRTALLNLIFNILRAAYLMILLTIFPGIFDLIQSLSPDNIGRQIANTHTIFAIVSVITLLPFTDYIVKLTQLILPVNPEENRIVEERKLVYMNNLGEISPSKALNLAQKEISRMGFIALDNLRMAVLSFFDRSAERDAIVEETEDTVNYLEHAILSKLAELRTPDMLPGDLDQVYRMTLTVSDIERLSDHAENIIEYSAQLRSGKATLSPEAGRELRSMCELTLESVELCLQIFETQDYTRLHEAQALEDQVDKSRERLIQSHVKRFVDSTCEPRGGVLFCDMVTDLERCSDHAINIAASLNRSC